ncbi:MAG: hypothetical protein J5663_09050 [Bacteroidaceae bacterium]|nr:hypothetical protein [Bacteroidaceae bacterium]
MIALVTLPLEGEGWGEGLLCVLCGRIKKYTYQTYDCYCITSLFDILKTKERERKKPERLTRLQAGGEA